MITLNKEFTSAEEMDKFIKTYLQDYPPAGYGTDVKIKLKQTYEEWKLSKISYAVEITRLESCD
jgi:hypothetical protein